MRTGLGLIAAGVCAMVLAAGCATQDRAVGAEDDRAAPTTAQGATEASFIEMFRLLCGQSYEGRAVFTVSDNEEMADKRMVMHIETCEQDLVRVPFHVNDDRSRTWILSVTDRGLLLKHDHRDPDGTPHDLTNYGGYARSGGTGFSQSFPADRETISMLPEGATNVWTMEFDTERQVFVYDLQRHGRPRFRAEFDLSRPLDTR